MSSPWSVDGVSMVKACGQITDSTHLKLLIQSRNKGINRCKQHHHTHTSKDGGTHGEPEEQKCKDDLQGSKPQEVDVGA